MLIKSHLIVLSFALRLTSALPKCIEHNVDGDRNDGDEELDLARRDPQWRRGGLSSLIAGAAAVGVANQVWEHVSGNDDSSGYDYWNSGKECTSPASSPDSADLPYTPQTQVAAQPAPLPPALPAQPAPASISAPSPESLTGLEETPYSEGGGWAPAIGANKAVDWSPAVDAMSSKSEAEKDETSLEPNSQHSPVAPHVSSAQPRAVPPKAPSQEKKQITVTTTAETIICRKFPDIISAETVHLTVFAPKSKVSIDCWTSASLPGVFGKVQGDSIWLRTLAGCYINQQSVIDNIDFLAQLNFCVSPPHWIGTAEVKTAPQDCHQCPSLKCPSQNLGSGEHIDVKCIVDGEDARGNNTWIQPVDQRCFLPATLFKRDGWLGTFGGKC
ncbi:hypothetical protein EJ08DRAFT_660808 [Tothia fuscella]|uniref:Uncharacterized protein n=1 Tax=Tothia fuscella TaxID=1048955 RepID=A0A9P4NRI8_9PEZI|nr:hypothetical protein EJ08DRAFT_660808 [Tothia fuscella]